MPKAVKRFSIALVLLLILAAGLVAALLIVLNTTSANTAPSVERILYPGNSVASITGMSEKLAYYMGKNPDVVGLVRLDGTLLEAPVVQSDPEDAYLRRNLDGEYHIAGTPFLAAGTQIGCPGSNLVIFGHNMPDGTLFGTLMGYKELDYLIAHPVIQFESAMGNHSFHVVSVFYADAAENDFDYANFSQLDETTGPEFLAQIRLRSLYSIQLAAAPEDQFLTLSTCAYEAGGNNGRLVVVGRLLAEGEQPDVAITAAEDPLLPKLFRGRV